MTIKRAYVDKRQRRSGDLDVLNWNDEGDHVVMTRSEYTHMQQALVEALLAASKLREEIHRRGNEAS